MQIIKRKIKQATSTPVGKIIFFSVLTLVLAGIAGGLIYWQIHKKQIIREQLESAVHGKSNGLYRLHYDKLDLDEIGGFLSVKELHIAYDSNKYVSLVNAGKAPAILLKIHLPEITVSGVKTPKALLDKEIEGTRLELKNPEIEIIYTLKGKDSSRNVPDREIYEQILGDLNLIAMDTIVITGAHIRTTNMKTKQTGFEFTNASLQLTGVRVDSLASTDTTRLLFAKQITAACESGTCLSANERYHYRIKDLSLNSSDHSVSMKSFMLDPLLGETAYMKNLRTQDDRFDFTVQDVIIKNLDFFQLVKEEVYADSLLIGSASFKIYRDLNVKRDTKNRVGTYPQQAVMKIPVPVAIKKIIVKNAFVEYKEKSAISKESGKVQFYQVYATISNFTNKDELIASNNKMTADINCRFLDKVPFKTTWVFLLGNQNGRFNVEGNMGAIDAKAMSVLTEPMGPARIEEGKINSVYFNLAGNDYSMNGTVKVLYEDLKVALLERDKDSKEMDKKSLSSFVANILIKNANPSGNKDPRIATVAYKRDTNRSIFNMTWKALFQGIQETVGIKKKQSP